MKTITLIMALCVTSLSFGQIIVDGGFETIGASGESIVVQGTGAARETGIWASPSAGNNLNTIVSSNADVGTYALQLDSRDNACKVHQNVILTPNTTYTCSFRVRKVNADVGDDTKVLVFKVVSNAGNVVQTATEGTFGYAENQAWKVKRSTLSTSAYESVSFVFTTGELTDFYLAIALQPDAAGSPVLLDEISITEGVYTGLSNEEFTAKNSFNYAPNPTNGIINLSASERIEKVEFFSLLGQKEFAAPVNALSKRVNISSLQSGIYLMQVTVDNAVGTYKIIKN
ncbi:T9SS type A sorting domain-containing protein [Carboxylicivirga marina]|uniref:T9SS type A sorting domain-containing protein n=1 Tax=Carboxylicivirga marina TaxID=2800988 RepID=A0ABS1HQS4_9BACT|nr:T9SS type A sorting domain-containing protein [Carboxylicivirga marina]MBK3519514.1 T9SS type A sorting domain-containing protein [Carboxylicivirga marina]